VKFLVAFALRALPELADPRPKAFSKLGDTLRPEEE
jgi:hypothetical protein